MLYKLRIRVVMQNRYLVIVLGVRLLYIAGCVDRCTSMIVTVKSRTVSFTRLLPPGSGTLAHACIGQEVSTELELGHGCRVYG